MSGFCAVLHTDGQAVSDQLLQKLTDAMSFRGPDARATWCKGSVGLGHTLLRTVDGDVEVVQPFSLDEDVWIVADARIDNRADLIAQLQSKQQSVVKEVADVELLLRAYHVWGESCLEYVIGDFGFVIWDGRCQRIFAAHDHFGVIPLYYAQIANTLLISNTRQVLLQHPLLSKRLCKQAIGDLLVLGMNYEQSSTFYEEIKRLCPGQKLVWQSNTCRISTYWVTPIAEHTLRYRRDEEYVEHFRSLFEQAVAARLRTTSVASHLSGGLDASSIAVTAHKLLCAGTKAYDFRAYTFDFEQLPNYEEGRLAQKIADYRGFPLEHIALDAILSQPAAMPPAFRSPEPAAIPNRTGETEIMRRAISFSRVLLVGFGGDPLLNDTVFPVRGGRLSDWVVTLTSVGRYVALYKKTPKLGLRRFLTQRFRVKQPLAVPVSLPPWLNPDFVRDLDMPTRIQTVFQKMEPNYHGMMSTPLWSNLFSWADPGHTGMLLKYRFPFFDLRLVNFISTIPTVPWLQSKWILRRAMRSLLPEAILQRPKTYFPGDPFPEILQQDQSAPWVEEILSTPDLDEYINLAELRTRLRSSERKYRLEARQLSSALVFAYWKYQRL